MRTQAGVVVRITVDVPPAKECVCRTVRRTGSA